jgi:transposase-like protein
MVDDLPQTLIDAVRYFADLDICHAYLRKIRWLGGCVCPYCESRNVGEISGRRLRCKDCRKDIRDTAGTIFHSSHVTLDKWLPAVWHVVSCKNGVSSHEMARTLGVTQKTAWFMDHRIREAMRTRTFERMHGEVESDESFVGT